ncbi:MAG TPA: recombinase family protein [Vicinamibacterales bacterium]|nr:recombinase family protein [Vicinamibacterales bacterium]
MTRETHSKVHARHLQRHAYLYIRQSSLRQVLEHTESTQRQYNLKQRAIALGWASDQIVVVDNDQGLSGASAVDRAGFQTLVADVGMGRAGMVMGLEVSRLARNSTDWHRLLEICALTDTLILDEDGIYDPAHFNDRLLLGLKGTMSEAELHVLRARLIGGILNKARRGELQCRVPIGLVYDAAGRVVLDPDQQVQHTIRVLFETFRRTGSATATVKSFREQGLSFPRRIWHGARKGEVVWGPLDHPRTLWVLHNPRYAGAFVYGRTRQRHQTRKYHKLPREEWMALVRDAHPSYISWDQFEQHQVMLRDNAAGYGTDRRRSPPREGPALLQGLVLCGRCGLRMTVRYHQSRGALVPIYACQREGIQHGHAICQQVTGTSIDKAIGALVVDAVSPMALEVTLGIQQELQSRLDEADALRRKAVERAQYDVDLARQRFMRVDPNNRLVADSLEADWNHKLRLLNEAQERYQQQRDADCLALSDEQRARILTLANDVPRLWRDAATPDRERKRMLRLIVDDVTLVKGTDLVVHVRFRGGATRTLTLPRPAPAWALRQTSAEVVAEIDRLLGDYTDVQIARVLTDNGFRSGMGKAVNPMMVARVRDHYHLKSRYDRLRERGLLTLVEVAGALDISIATAKQWRLAGLLTAHAYNDKNQYLYERPGPGAPVRHKPKGITRWKSARRSRSHPTHEVQYEA